MIKKIDNKIRIFADFKNLYIARDFVRSIVEKLFFPESEVIKIMVAVDEACTNIIKYSFRDNPLSELIFLAKFYDNQLIFEICDQGHTFDPVQYLSIHQVEFPTKIKESGRGLYLISKLMDSIEYFPKSTNNDYNRLVLKKFFV